MIRSRNGVTLRIRDADDGMNSVLLETPGGQRITLQDGPSSVRVEDGNGNAVTMTTSGVTVHASRKVSINSVVSASYTPGAGNVW
jgi:hypothetical protein